ncbi:hypothetical protein [Raineya sp.]
MLKQIFAIVSVAMLLSACGQKSEKGAWSEKDKGDFKKGCLQAYDEKLAKEEFFKVMGIAKDDFVKVCDCSIQKLEATYAPQDIIKGDKLSDDAQKLMDKCFVENFVGEKGAWKPKFKEIVSKQMEEMTVKKAHSDEEKAILQTLGQCMLEKVEKEFEIADVMSNTVSNASMGKIKSIAENCAVELKLGMDILGVVFEKAAQEQENQPTEGK